MPLWQPSKVLARPAYYDRVPETVQGGYNAGLAPHGLTQRVIYSPPYQRSAFVETIVLFMLRIGSTATPGLSGLWWHLVPASGGGGHKVSYVGILDGNVGASIQQMVTSLGYLAYNDTLYAFTQDQSVGGTMYYDTAFKGIEFTY